MLGVRLEGKIKRMNFYFCVSIFEKTKRFFLTWTKEKVQKRSLFSSSSSSANIYSNTYYYYVCYRAKSCKKVNFSWCSVIVKKTRISSLQKEVNSS